MVKTIINSAIAIALILGVLGCAATNKGEIKSYVEVTYDSRSIKHVAVFPIGNDHFEPSKSRKNNKELFKSLSRQINKTIINSLTSKNPEITIISPSDSSRKINVSGLASKWRGFVYSYYDSGIINKEILYKVSKSLGVDAVLIGQLMPVYKSYGYEEDTADTTKVTVIFSILEVSTAITVWEVTVDGIAKREMDMKDPPVSEAVYLAVEKVTEKIPRF